MSNCDVKRAIACSIATQSNDVRYNLDECKALAKTAGIYVLRYFYQNREKSHPKLYLGSGKIEEIKAYIDAECISIFIADDELSPLQQRSLEQALGIQVLDRTALVLDIFASRAKTHEAKLQVEYAQLAYLKPRLTRLWTHLSRLGGGIGTKGPGETQLEVDKRLINKRMSVLRKGIEKVKKNRFLQRKNRSNIIRGAIVGYTNSGKSTLLNQLTTANVMAENKPFATLDPTTRKLWLAQDRNLLLTDTVGFIHKLPHQLIDAFQSTLEEAKEADLLIHVLDASSPYFNYHFQVANQLLEELQMLQKPTLILLNKIDQVKDISLLNHFIKGKENVLCISANNRSHTVTIRERLLAFLNEIYPLPEIKEALPFETQVL